MTSVERGSDFTSRCCIKLPVTLLTIKFIVSGVTWYLIFNIMSFFVNYRSHYTWMKSSLAMYEMTLISKENYYLISFSFGWISNSTFFKSPHYVIYCYTFRIKWGMIYTRMPISRICKFLVKNRHYQLNIYFIDFSKCLPRCLLFIYPLRTLLVSIRNQNFSTN